MSDDTLQRTPLADTHQSMGGKMVDFGGWWMPVNYGSQIEEHQAVRNAAGMFDVSHMTVVDLKGDDAKTYLQYLLANDVEKLKSEGKALYTAMLNEQGGVIDDLIVYLMSWGYRLVVNCSTREKDLAWMNRQAEAFEVSLQEREDLAMIAVQGPQARALVAELLPQDAPTLNELGVFYGVALTGERTEWFAARTGYTGEDGFEIMLPAPDAIRFWQALADKGVAPCGLGARDTLRLEAGMNLYGHEMDEHTSPLVANMAWTLSMSDARDFIGKQALETRQASGIDEKLVGLILRSRGVLRESYPVMIEGCDQQGVITSGTFSPSLQMSIALARVPVTEQTQAKVKIRNKWVDVEMCAPCFVRKGKALVS